MKRKLSVFLLLGVLSILSCSEGDDLKPGFIHGDHLKIDRTSADVSGEGEVWYTYYSSDNDLKIISSVPSWIRVDISRDLITVRAFKNDTGSERYADIVFLSSYRTEKIKVRQDKVSELTIKEKEMYVFDDGMCTNWELGKDAYKFYYDCVSEYNLTHHFYNDALLLNFLKKNYTALTVSGYGDNIFRQYLTSSTTYYLCAVALDKNGNAGPIYKKKFTTRSTYEPVALITSFYLNYSNSWKYNVYLKNNAKKYYAWINSTESKTTHEHFLAWYAYHQIKSGSLSYTTSLSNSYTSTSDYLHLITVAVDSYGDLGNYDYNWATRSSYSKAVSPSLGSKDEESPYGCISIEELEKNMIRIE